MNQHSQRKSSSENDTIAEIVVIFAQGMYIAACFGACFGAYSVIKQLDLGVVPEPASAVGNKEELSSAITSSASVELNPAAEEIVIGNAASTIPVPTWQQKKSSAGRERRSKRGSVT